MGLETIKTASTAALAAIAGAAQVSEGPGLSTRQVAVSQQAIAPGATISHWVSPATVADLATVLAAAQTAEWSIIPCGAGSKLDWGGLITSPAIALSTQHLNRLVDHAVGDLTVTVEAGMPFATLQALLAEQGQFLAIDPAYPDQATIGGVIATGDTGSLRHRYTSVRDMVLGIEFVRADGQIAKAGGRVVKNVAGYDLMKLFTGSYGTLGVLTQVTLRVYPLPDSTKTVVLTGEGGAIAQVAQQLIRSALTPVSVDLVSATVVANLGLGQGEGLLVRFQGIGASVHTQSETVATWGRSQSLAVAEYAPADDPALWQRLRDQITPPTPTGAIACKIGIQPTAAIALYRHIDSLEVAGWAGQIHLGSGLGWLVFPTVEAAIVRQIRTFCQTHSGFLTMLQAPPPVKQQLDVWGDVGPALATMQAIKQTFDPQRRLSSGRFVGGI